MSLQLIHGVDVTQISRVEFDNEHLIGRILHPQELLSINKKDSQLQNKDIAIRWAIKEAIFKALCLKDISYQDIIIEKLDDQYQWVNLPSYIKQFVISTSIEQDVCIASVFGLVKY